MKREIVFRPAYDKRNTDPNKNYGIHGVEMCWYLTGDKGVIQFVVFTNWHLPHVQEELQNKVERGGRMNYLCLIPQPADIGYHSPTPMYKGQTGREDCTLLDGKTCYYDGSGLQAEEGFKILVEQGHEAVWNWMEEKYQSFLGGSE